MIKDILYKMIDISLGNTHDINHFLKVYSYAKLIGEMEHLDQDTQITLEIAAIIHDIACPLCRMKYGNTNARNQEIEGIQLAKDFLDKFNLDESTKTRIIYLVGHHHTLDMIDGIDYQILIEADYLVNADESHYSITNIQNFKSQYFKTTTGIKLLETIFER